MITSSCEPLNPVRVIIILTLPITLPSTYFMYLSHNKSKVSLVALNKLAHCFPYIHTVMVCAHQKRMELFTQVDYKVNVKT